MSTAKISAATWTGNGWSVFANIELADGTRYGSHFVELPEEATEDELAAAVLVLYEPPAPPEPTPTKKKK